MLIHDSKYIRFTLYEHRIDPMGLSKFMLSEWIYHMRGVSRIKIEIKNFEMEPIKIKIPNFFSCLINTFLFLFSYCYGIFIFQ